MLACPGLQEDDGLAQRAGGPAKLARALRAVETSYHSTNPSRSARATIGRASSYASLTRPWRTSCWIVRPPNHVQSPPFW